MDKGEEGCPGPTRSTHNEVTQNSFSIMPYGGFVAAPLFVELHPSRSSAAIFTF